MSENTNFVSLLPEDFSEGGGLPAVDTVSKLNFAFTMYTFSDKPVPCLMMEIIDNDTGENYGQQYYAAGSPEAWNVSDDGKNLIPVGTKKKLAGSSDVAQVIKALINAGFPTDRLAEGDITKATGVVALIGEIPALDFKGSPRKRKAKDGKEYDATLLVPVEIRELPGANPNVKKGAKAAPPPAAKKPAAPKAADTAKDETAPKGTENAATGASAVEEKATAFILDMLTEAGADGLPKKGLAGAAMKKFSDDTDRTAIVKTVGSDAFLSSSEVWSYENGMLTLL